MNKKISMPFEVYSANVTANAKLLYVILKQYEGNDIFPSAEHLAEQFTQVSNLEDVRAISVRNWINELESCGIIKKIRNGRNNSYELLV